MSDTTTVRFPARSEVWFAPKSVASHYTAQVRAQKAGKSYYVMQDAPENPVLHSVTGRVTCTVADLIDDRSAPNALQS